MFSLDIMIYHQGRPAFIKEVFFLCLSSRNTDKSNFKDAKLVDNKPFHTFSLFQRITILGEEHHFWGAGAYWPNFLLCKTASPAVMWQHGPSHRRPEPCMFIVLQSSILQGHGIIYHFVPSWYPSALSVGRTAQPVVTTFFLSLACFPRACTDSYVRYL